MRSGNAAQSPIQHNTRVDFPRSCDTMRSGRHRVMKLTSTAFADGEKLPKEFAKIGANRIPPLKIEGVPNGAKSLALIMHDPDAPMAGGFYHWTLWNIPPETTAIGEGAVPRGAVEGKTSWGTSGYNVRYASLYLLPVCARRDDRSSPRQRRQSAQRCDLRTRNRKRIAHRYVRRVG